MSALRLSEIDKMGHAERLPTIFGNYTGNIKEDSKGGITRLSKMRKPQCTVVHEDFRFKRNEESTLLSPLAILKAGYNLKSLRIPREAQPCNP